MNRDWTNRIRFVLDELIPPIIRDSRWFMWPLFVAAYGRISVGEIMDFKSKAYRMSDDEYRDFYSNLGNSMSRRRITDLNSASVDFVLGIVRERRAMLKSVLDIGAGNGYLLEMLSHEMLFSRMAGVDAVQLSRPDSAIEFHSGLLPKLPFRDKEFDLVTCTHVLEHVLDIEASVKELIRIARHTIIVVVPRQRYYRYTLDEHLNFYPLIDPLARLFSPHKVTSLLIGGDWALLIELSGDISQSK